MHRLHAYPDLRAMFRRLLIATLIGILAALAVAAFRHAMQLLEWIFLSNNTGSLVNAAEGLSPWRRLITPALGGLAAGLLLWGWQKMNQQRPHAPTDYMEALQTDGQFDVGASLVKSLASLLVVVSGSAIGREGAMILLAALAASSFARRFTPREEWKLWIASGAAAGMAGAYHAPLAGSLFIAEILFGTLMLASLGPVVVSAVVALLTTHLLNGSDSLLYTVHLTVDLHAREYVMIVSTGLVAGLCGPLLMWLMTASHNSFLRLKLSPPWQLALGGLIVGLLSLLTPTVWGNGYSVVQSFLLSPPLFSLIGGIFVCKILAVLASSGSGAPGGVFTPTLFVGLSIGMFLGRIWGFWLPGSDEIAILLGLAGMATLLAATTHAPIMSTLMICEMTGEYQLLPGLLIACVVASVLSRTLRHDSIYRQHAAEH
ncbi:voltage-gated ClC-type chloride channel ClcB [Salmonella enterica subsp. enterica]|nr:voltage-gated ClC-type chloride channel ClcB [Salmonella enterica subsp. enterica serovar Meleagridis]